MLNVTCYLLHFPGEVRCEAQKLATDDQAEPSTDHNLILKMELQQMKYMFMMEYTLRIVDYSLNCITKLFNTGLANADLAADDSDEEIS